MRLEAGGAAFVVGVNIAVPPCRLPLVPVHQPPCEQWLAGKGRVLVMLGSRGVRRVAVTWCVEGPGVLTTRVSPSLGLPLSLVAFLP